MAKKLGTFDSGIKKILGLKFNHVFGDKILYDTCEDRNFPWGVDNRLADKIWLVGRSYAATLERIIKVDKKGDGTGDFFRKFVEIIFSKFYSQYIDLINKAKALHPLDFSFSNTDIGRLCDGIECVLKFNELVKDVAIYYDKIYQNNIFKQTPRNLISFSSKFVHFHLPHTVFIFDRYTENGGKCLVRKTRSNKKLSGEGGFLVVEDEMFEISKADYDAMSEQFARFKCLLYQNFQPEIAGSNNQNIIKSYVEHCLREYVICGYVKDCLKLTSLKNIYSYPRLADSICQRIISLSNVNKYLYWLQKDYVVQLLNNNKFEELFGEWKSNGWDTLILEYILLTAGFDFT